MPPFRMLINMVEAYDKFQRRKSSEHDKGIKKIQGVLKANRRELWKNVSYHSHFEKNHFSIQSCNIHQLIRSDNSYYFLSCFSQNIVDYTNLLN
jgi:hypothetical protein